jgi:hypothetical protein
MKSTFRVVASLLVALCALTIRASGANEFVDGDNEPPTQLNGMHSCPYGAVVTGVHVNRNRLSCMAYLGEALRFPVRQDWGVTTTNQFPFDGTSMHWCGPGEIVRGVHVDGNGFNCQGLASWVINQYGPLGPPTLERGSSPTVRNGMHTCPQGSVLVGAHFATNTFLCSTLPVCMHGDSSQCSAGKTCVLRAPPSGPDGIHSIDGRCQ